jgi:hypothetical protein
MRLQLELPEDGVRQLKDLMAEAKIDTYKELFTNALTLLRWSVREVKSGRIIASVDEQRGKYKELAMPIFEAVAGDRNADARQPEQSPAVTG